MTAKLLPRFKREIDRFVLIPSRGGCFELKVGDKLIYSKLQTGRFPDEAALIDQVAAALLTR